MQIERIAFMERLAAHTPASLVAAADLVRRRFELPGLRFGHENENNWAEVEHLGIEYNLSIPDDPGKLHEWNPAVAADCTLALNLSVASDLASQQTRAFDPTRLAPLMAGELSLLLRCTVHHVECWRGPGLSEAGSGSYPPPTRVMPFRADGPRQEFLLRAAQRLSLGVGVLDTHAIIGFPDEILPGAQAGFYRYRYLLHLPTRPSESNRFVELGFDDGDRLVRLDLI